MPYFIIIPAYLFLLLVLGIAAFATWMHPPWKPACAYLVAGLLGTIPGFVAANVLITLAGILPVLVVERFSLPEGLQQACGVFAGIALLLGPFLASTVGIVLGFLAGCWWVRRRRK